MHGFKAKLHQICDPSEFYGETILHAELRKNLKDGDHLILQLSSGRTIKILDEEQFCCEARYMTCDDDIQSLIGHTLRKIEVKEGPSVEREYQTQEIAFLEITTNAGFVTIANHNDHNGYYGGFALVITEET